MKLPLHRENHQLENGRTEDQAASDQSRRHLIDGLNQDLAGELKAIGMYTYYSAMLTGPYRGALRTLFLAEIAEEQSHAQYLSDKIAVLGGEPTTNARPIAQADQPLEMLKHALTAEIQAITGYTTRLDDAESFGDFGLKVELENIIGDETRHKEEIERILAGWQTTYAADFHAEDHWPDDGGRGVKQSL